MSNKFHKSYFFLFISKLSYAIIKYRIGVYMQNSNLSSKIFPIIKEDWENFLQKVEHELQEMITIYNNDKRRIKDLERLINKIKEISDLSKDNMKEILNYKELFLYIDNSLESSFDALNFFLEQDNFDNVAVKSIYERIVTSPKIIKLNSEYSGLSIKVQFDKERIKRLGELIRGSKIDFTLIKELLNKYQLDDNKKKNILFYPVVMLSIRQNDLRNSKEKSKDLKEKFYQERFNELIKDYQKKKESFKELLVYCFNIRKNMNQGEIETYNAFVNNPTEIGEYDFNDEIKFKIYTLAFFKLKKDIESYIDGIIDLQIDSDLDGEIVFFHEMIGEFENLANILNGLMSINSINDDLENSNVYFALDAFNRLIIKKELLVDKNKSSIKALLQKADSINNARIEGVRTNHMLGVEDEEKLLGKSISMVTTSKMKLAYIVINKNILIISGVANNNEKFDRVVKLAVNKNMFAIKNQISLIEEEDLDYIELQNRIINSIIGEDSKKLI